MTTSNTRARILDALQDILVGAGYSSVTLETVLRAGDGLYMAAIAGLPRPDPELTRRTIDRLVGSRTRCAGLVDVGTGEPFRVRPRTVGPRCREGVRTVRAKPCPRRRFVCPLLREAWEETLPCARVSRVCSLRCDERRSSLVCAASFPEGPRCPPRSGLSLEGDDVVLFTCPGTWFTSQELCCRCRAVGESRARSPGEKVRCALPRGVDVLCRPGEWFSQDCPHLAGTSTG